MMMRAISSKFLISDRRMYIITSKLNSTFGMIGKAKDIKMTSEVISKNLCFFFSKKN